MTDPRQEALGRIPATRPPADDAVAVDPRRAALGRTPAARVPVKGGVVVARPTADTDHDEIRDLHLRCSDATRYRRYHCGLIQPTPSMLVNMTDRTKGLYLAVHEPEGQMVGLCGLAFTDEACAVEMGLLVADEWQGRGIGQAVCELLLKAAREAGFDRVMAHVVAENRRAVTFMTRLGATTTKRTDPCVVSLVFTLKCAGAKANADADDSDCDTGTGCDREMV
ncbi:GNAT family N-acetyltransferase [Actinomadura barringtoniae]|uniref:GNAT family N-acetyltransferase n=1 Tax=Actinomadura barringtoniae TaxID=1427535 RepID=A0A939T3A4_9ACTN|nr:GNAT family N-acetyltransferase [Actinomadura barringtoniae]MBO2446349.1 GNAT family N-acetyltransferase [Actinomadura barringtoniae]